MKPDIKKTIESQIESLPVEIKKLVLGDEWKTWVGHVVKKNVLNLDQASSLEAEIFLFLIGLSSISELRKSIEQELMVPTSKVNEIIIDINNYIVEPLKQKLIQDTSDMDVEKVPAPVAESLALKDREEEILDRQKVLREIEEAAHAPGVGVYVPNEKGNAVPSHEMGIKKVQPIAQNNQINTAPSIPVSQPLSQPVSSQPKPVSIFEAKASTMVAPQPGRTNVVVPEKEPIEKSIEVKKAQAQSSDPYREPIA